MFIQTVPEAQAAGAVQQMYAENIAGFGYLPNYVQAFSLRPHVLAAWGAVSGCDQARYGCTAL